MSQLSHLDASSCDSNRNGHKSEADAANGSQTGRDIDLSSPFGHQCVCVRWFSGLWAHFIGICTDITGSKPVYRGSPTVLISLTI